MNSETNNDNKVNPQLDILNRAYSSANTPLVNEIINNPNNSDQTSENLIKSEDLIEEVPATINPIVSEISNEEVNPEDQIQLQSNNVFLTPIEKSNTAINELNVDGTYNNIVAKNYENDPKVQENIKQFTQKKTIALSGEAKTFLVIAVIILIFIIIMPYLYDIIREIKY